MWLEGIWGVELWGDPAVLPHAGLSSDPTLGIRSERVLALARHQPWAFVLPVSRGARQAQREGCRLGLGSPGPCPG